jgi:cytochrome c-type biogenesis protein CcmH/NrfG
MTGDRDRDADRRRALLRQLRDLDDDLAAGKLDEQDHRRLREPVEREAAAALRDGPDEPSAAPGGQDRASAAPGGQDRDSAAPGGQDRASAAPGGQDRDSAAPGRPDAASATGGGEGTTATRRHRAAAARRGAGGPAVGRASAVRRRRRIVAAVAAAAGVAGVAALLADAATPRGAGGTISGSAPAAVATASAAAPAGGSVESSADPSAAPSLSPEQAAAIDAAALDVKAHPRDVGKHLTLAHAYADAGATQLAAVEYLAILRLDPGNAEANTAMALLAFEVGRTQQAKDMLDRVLRADPRYPEALYVRGLVLLGGLHQPAAATRDLHAYLAVAPYGSHRTAAETLLALAGGPR